MTWQLSNVSALFHLTRGLATSLPVWFEDNGTEIHSACHTQHETVSSTHIHVTQSVRLATDQIVKLENAEMHVNDVVRAICLIIFSSCKLSVAVGRLT